ncbi:uncharacterized protein [Littorina saxatilis]|uniref:Uncharacterized protein n=1 Tax=Littorina saxatilis TaxID=31220 RepID=A0AAN9GLK3_9CAEN
MYQQDNSKEVDRTATVMTCLRRVFLFLLLSLFVSLALTDISQLTETKRRCSQPTLRAVEERVGKVYVCNADQTGWTGYSSCYDQCDAASDGGIVCNLNDSLQGCWLATGDVGPGNDANHDNLLIDEKEFVGDCAEMADGLFLTQGDYTMCKDGKKVSVTQACQQLKPCVVKAKDWTMVCQDNVNPVLGLFCAVLDLKDAAASDSSSPVRALVSSVLNNNLPETQNQPAIVGLLIRTQTVLQLQIQAIPQSPQYMHSFSKTNARHFHPQKSPGALGAFDLVHNSVGPGASERRKDSVRDQHHLPSGLAGQDRLRFSDGGILIRRRKRRGKGKSRTERDLASVAQLKGAGDVGRGRYWVWKEQGTPKLPSDGDAKATKTYNLTKKGRQDENPAGSPSPGDATPKDSASKTGKEALMEKLTVDSMVHSPLSSSKDVQRPDEKSESKVVNQKNQLAGAATKLNLHVSSSTKSPGLLGEKENIASNAVLSEKKASQSNEYNLAVPLDLNDQIPFGGKNRSETLKDKVGTQPDQDLARTKSRNKSNINPTPPEVFMTTVVQKISSLFDPDRGQKPDPKNNKKELGSSATAPIIDHGHDDQRLQMGQQFGSLMSFLHHLTNVAGADLPRFHAVQSKPNGIRSGLDPKQKDEQRNPPHALLKNPPTKGDKGVDVHFRMVVAKKHPTNHIDRGVEMGIVSLTAGSASPKGPGAKGQLGHVKGNGDMDGKVWRDPQQKMLAAELRRIVEIHEKQKSRQGLPLARKGSLTVFHRLISMPGVGHAHQTDLHQHSPNVPTRPDERLNPLTNSAKEDKQKESRVNMQPSGDKRRNGDTIKKVTHLTKSDFLSFPKFAGLPGNSSSPWRLTAGRKAVLASSSAKSFLLAMEDKKKGDSGRAVDEKQDAHAVPAARVKLTNKPMTHVVVLPKVEDRPNDHITENTNVPRLGEAGNSIHLSIRKRPGIPVEMATSEKGKPSGVSMTPSTNRNTNVVSLKDKDDIIFTDKKELGDRRSQKDTDAGPAKVEPVPDKKIDSPTNDKNITRQTETSGKGVSANNTNTPPDHKPTSGRIPTVGILESLLSGAEERKHSESNTPDQTNEQPSAKSQGQVDTKAQKATRNDFTAQKQGPEDQSIKEQKTHESTSQEKPKLLDQHPKTERMQHSGNPWGNVNVANVPGSQVSALPQDNVDAVEAFNHQGSANTLDIKDAAKSSDNQAAANPETTTDSAPPVAKEESSPLPTKEDSSIQDGSPKKILPFRTVLPLFPPK